MAGRRRFDPVAKAADGRVLADRVSGKSPDRHYALVDPNDQATGLPSYLARGYETELRRSGGPVIPGMIGPEGTPLSKLGMLLVSRSMVDHEAEVEAGQQLTTELENRILKAGGIDDGMRGRGYEIAINRAVGAGEEA